MPPKTAKREQRVRVTNKALESRQFSTIKAPRKSEVANQKVDVEMLYHGNDNNQFTQVNNQQLCSHSDTISTNKQNSYNGKTDASGLSIRRQASELSSFKHGFKSNLKTSASSSVVSSKCAFDPIPNDPMFVVVPHSKYWPPPSLEELARQTGVDISGNDGFDLYDRVADDARAKKEHTHIVKGELNHPRGKPRQNTITRFDDSSSDGSDDGEDNDKNNN